MDAVRPPAERAAKPFRRQVEELQSYLDPPEDAQVKAIPAAGGNAPPLWLLGSTTTSAQLAADLGLPYAFAHHLNPGAAARATRVYRDRFRPSARAAAPTVLVSVSAIAAEDDARAEWLAGSTRLKVLSQVRGNRIQLPTPEDAADYSYTDDDRAEIAAHSGSVLTGSPETLAERLRSVLDATAADELMVTTPVYHHADRRRSYELLATALVPIFQNPR
nr:MsnO8 family LLM class oxidoreductase [Amycolatopsis acididurans]